MPNFVMVSEALFLEVMPRSETLLMSVSVLAYCSNLHM